MNNFSRAKQRQYISLHTMKVLAEHVHVCMNGRVNSKTQGCLDRIERRRLKLLENYTPTDKQRRAVIRKWRDAMAKYKNDDSWISPIEYASACLLLADDMHSAGAKPANEWRLLTQGLFTLCKHLDPELDHDDHGDGQKMGEMIMAGI